MSDADTPASDSPDTPHAETSALSPFLMFTGEAEAALTFYAETFGGAIEVLERNGPGGPGEEGKVMRAAVRLRGQRVLATDSPPVHAFAFTPSMSLWVDCRDEADLRALAEALGEGGAFLMPVENYGFSRLFAWVQDRFGVSWQLNLV